MGFGHPLALRSRIIDMVKAGASARKAARRFAVSLSNSLNPDGMPVMSPPD